MDAELLGCGSKNSLYLCGRFSSVFPSLNMAVKRREQALQDYRRLQAKVEKYEEKEKTGPVLAKLHQVPRRERWVWTTGPVGDVWQVPPSPGDQLWGLGDQDTRCDPHPTPAPNIHIVPPAYTLDKLPRAVTPSVLSLRPEKSFGLCGTTLRPRTSSSWMRCRGSTTAAWTTSSPALSP